MSTNFKRTGLGCGLRCASVVSLILLAAILAACDGAVAGPAATPTPPDPWAEAVHRAQLELEEAADFQARLDYYRRASVKIGGRLEVVEKVEPDLDIIDKLKAEEIPFLGSGWEALKSALERSSPGSGETLAELSRAMRQAAGFRETLGELEALQPVAEAGRAFEDDPGAETLQALADRCATAAPALSRAGEKMAALVAVLEKPLGGIDALGPALEETRANDVPVIASGATELARIVKESREPLEELHRELVALNAAVERDLRTMQAIQDIASGVAPASAESAPATTAESSDLLSGLLLVLGFVVLIVVLAAAGQRTGTLPQAEEPAAGREAIAVAPPPPQVEEPAAAPPPVEQEPVAQAARPGGFLRVVRGAEPERVYELGADPASIGRRRDSDIRLAGRDVSRRHALIRYGRGSYFIQDQDSLHGTFVNGERVDACPLHDGDRIIIGGTELEFRYTAPPAKTDADDTA
jgi:pSer/pThr/pTyr-binding forkhead associated (FHA) protein